MSGRGAGKGRRPRSRPAPAPAPAPAPPGAPVTLRLGTAVAAGGDGLGRLDDGRVVFVEGGLPGEVVEAVAVDSRPSYLRARVGTVVSPSPVRVVPPCPWAAVCGGCQWQHVDPAAQAALKADVVADSFRRLAGITLPPLPAPLRVEPEGYRTTLRLAVDPDGRPAYRRRRSAELVGVDRCLVAHPALEDLLVRTRLRPPRPSTAPAVEVTLRVGVAGGERLVLPGPGAVVVEAPVDAVVAAPGRPAALREVVGGRWWRVSGGSFFQSGPAAAELLADMVADAVGPLPAGATVVDLYAGVGLLGGIVAARSAPGVRVVAVESSPSAAADAAANLADLAAAVEEAPVEGWTGAAAGAMVDVVIADPPRAGLGRAGVAAVAATAAPRVVLVSCDPASAARDAGLLVGAGWRVATVAVADLFPRTTHLEVVTAFERDRPHR